MSIATNDRPDPEAQERSENIVKLLRVLFHGDFCEEQEIAPHQKVSVLPVFFCGWLHKHMDLRSGEPECEQAQVPHETWEQLKTILDNGIAVEQLAPVWYTIVLSDRPKPLHQLKSIQSLILLTWLDGTISPLNVFVTGEMVQTPDKCFTDDLVAQILRNNTQGLVQKIAEMPLDQAHDGASTLRFKSTDPNDPDAYEVFGGLILKVLPQIKAELREPVRNYLRLFQSIVRPVVPAEVLRQYQARQARENNQPATGGWDDAPPG